MMNSLTRCLSLRMTRSAWTTPDQRICWLKCGDLMHVVFKSHVDPTRLVIRRRDVMFDAHQVWMPYMRTRVVDLGDFVVTMNGERGSLGARDVGTSSHVDYLRRMILKSEERTGCLIIKYFLPGKNPNCMTRKFIQCNAIL